MATIVLYNTGQKSEKSDRFGGAVKKHTKYLSQTMPGGELWSDSGLQSTGE